MILLRAFAAWLVVIAVEVVHGVLRAILLVPLVGDLPARQVGVPVGSLLVFAVACLFIRWIAARTKLQLGGVGLLWVVLTVLFEVGLGRLVETTTRWKRPWWGVRHRATGRRTRRPRSASSLSGSGGSSTGSAGSRKHLSPHKSDKHVTARGGFLALFRARLPGRIQVNTGENEQGFGRLGCYGACSKPLTCLYFESVVGKR
jgi:hypothetical protein